jgi:hypothetical protein
LAPSIGVSAKGGVVVVNDDGIFSYTSEVPADSFTIVRGGTVTRTYIDS